MAVTLYQYNNCIAAFQALSQPCGSPIRQLLQSVCMHITTRGPLKKKYPRNLILWNFTRHSAVLLKPGQT